jgi:hypothetical protein
LVGDHCAFALPIPANRRQAAAVARPSDFFTLSSPLLRAIRSTRLSRPRPCSRSRSPCSGWRAARPR